MAAVSTATAIIAGTLGAAAIGAGTSVYQRKKSEERIAAQREDEKRRKKRAMETQAAREERVAARRLAAGQARRPRKAGTVSEGQGGQTIGGPADTIG